MKRRTIQKIAFPLLLMLLLFAVAGCGGAASAPQEEAASGQETETEQMAEQTSEEEIAEATAETQPMAETEEGTISLIMYFVDPDTSPYAEGGKKIAEYVNEATNGTIQIEVIGGSERGERELVEGAMDNQVDIATCANSVLTNYIPQMNILDQAYLWKNADEAHAAVDGRLGELIKERAENLGLHVIGFEESGFRNTFSTKPIQTMDDFNGVTIRTMENKYHQAAFESFGATAVPLPYTEVMEKLEFGEIDACENATANCLNSGYYEITKNVTNTQHAFVYIILCMSDAAWNKIPADLQEPFLEAVQKGVAWERERLEEANAQATEQLKELGVSFYDIDIEQLQAAYQEAAAEKGFVFDAEWQAAVDEAIAQAE